VVVPNGGHLQHATALVVSRYPARQINVMVAVQSLSGNHFNLSRLTLVVQRLDILAVRRDVPAPVVGQRVVINVSNPVAQGAILTPLVAGHDKFGPILPGLLNIPNLTVGFGKVSRSVQANLLGRIDSRAFDGERCASCGVRLSTWWGDSRCCGDDVGAVTVVI